MSICNTAWTVLLSNKSEINTDFIAKNLSYWKNNHITYLLCCKIKLYTLWNFLRIFHRSFRHKMLHKIFIYPILTISSYTRSSFLGSINKGTMIIQFSKSSSKNFKTHNYRVIINKVYSILRRYRQWAREEYRYFHVWLFRLLHMLEIQFINFNCIKYNYTKFNCTLNIVSYILQIIWFIPH